MGQRSIFSLCNAIVWKFVPFPVLPPLIFFATFANRLLAADWIWQNLLNFKNPLKRHFHETKSHLSFIQSNILKKCSFRGLVAVYFCSNHCKLSAASALRTIYLTLKISLKIPIMPCKRNFHELKSWISAIKSNNLENLECCKLD